MKFIEPMRIPSFHDFNLVEIVWTTSRLEMSLEDEIGKRSRIILTGVESLRVEGLQEGNIVSEAKVFDKSNLLANSAELNEWLSYLISGDDPVFTEEMKKANKKSAEKLLDLIKTGGAQCFCLTPAYGATIVSICRSVELK